MSSTTFADIADEIRDAYQPSPTEELVYIGLEHIEQQSLHFLGEGSSKDVVSTKRKFQAGDILFGTLRPYFRKVVLARYNGVCSTDIAVIRPKNGISSRFVQYMIADKKFIDHSMGTSNGTRMPRAKWSIVSKYPLPSNYSDEMQDKVGSVLGAYDDLIENNSKRIEKLESMAQLLYRHYFETPETDDWEIVKIGDILGKAPSSAKLQKSEYLDVGTYPVIDQGKEYIAGFTNKLEAVIADKLPLTVFGDHTRAVKLAQDPFARGADGTQIVVSDILPPYYLYLTIKHLPLSNEHYARHFKLLKVTEIALPPENVLSKFEIEVEPIFKLINTLTKRNRSLSKARDMLLPRLMSGEIEV